MTNTMTDQELLELAAKAAGIAIDKSPFNGGGRGNTGFDASGNAVLDWHNGTTWNPLVDDGDALRLAVKLGIDLCFFDTGPIDKPKWQFTRARRMDVEASCGRPGDIDKFAATRRAIVRAAAAMELAKR